MSTHSTHSTHAAIRSDLGHGRGNRRVRIGRDGLVTYYGSTVDTDRQHDYWHYAGCVDDLAREAAIWRAIQTEGTDRES